MEKRTIQEIIVVEGKSDTRRLKSFFNVETIETNGLGLKKETIEMIRAIHSKRGVIVFTDPDIPGEKIRTKLNNEIPGLKNAFVLKEDARTKKKVGVEHADEETLTQALDHLVTYGNFKECLSYEEYCDLGLNGSLDSSLKREILSKKYHLGKCNSKTMFKRLNYLGITAKEIKESL